ncbi:MAG TPA: organic hydroperoxide resistance protein [Acidimicrobiales bacterium]|nr:organic hydroperoxide resistance protein [Acidimicrobiales bacterium]
MDATYATTAHATGDGRDGHVQTDDGLVDMDLRIPKEMGGQGGAANPEQLFAAGYAACFHSALKVVGRERNADVTGTEVSVTIGIGPRPGGAFGLGAEIDVHIPGADAATAQELAERAHEVCPYSNATRGNMEVQLTIV